MNKQLLGRVGGAIVLASVIIGMTGCATSRMAGIDTTRTHVNRMETILHNRDVYHLSDYEGVALLRLGKVGAVGFGAIGTTASVYVRNLETKDFGPPSFVSYGGISAGLAYGGLNIVDCVLLFRNREDAIKFAKRSVAANFSNEASFLMWGRKQMTIPGARSFSDGAGLALGAIELELVVGGSRDSLHKNMYQVDSVDKILLGDVAVPEELKEALDKLNVLMKR